MNFLHPQRHVIYVRTGTQPSAGWHSVPAAAHRGEVRLVVHKKMLGTVLRKNVY